MVEPESAMYSRKCGIDRVEAYSIRPQLNLGETPSEPKDSTYRPLKGQKVEMREKKSHFTG